MKKCCAILALLIIFATLSPIVGTSDEQKSQRKPAGSTLRIVNDELIKVNHGDCQGCAYAVKGSIYNPNNDGVKNVVISYRIWKKFMGKEDAKRGEVVRANGGLVVARIKYIPPKQTVDFLANEGIAPVYRDIEPDPINADEIIADWEDQ
jgi:hypothetical protein